MRVIIFDGGQNPPTFVCSLARELGIKLPFVAIAGKCNRLFPYTRGGIRRIPTGSNNRMVLLLQFILALCTLSPARLIFIRKSIGKENRFIRKIETFVLYASVLKAEPDILHIQWATHISLFEKLLKQGVFKTVVSFRGTMINVGSRINPGTFNLLHHLLPLADGYHAVSNAILDNAVLLGIDRTKAKVVYPAVDEKLLNIKKETVGHPVIRILSVGRAHWIKGYPVAIDACRILKDRHIDFHYTIIAGGDRDELYYQIADAGLEWNVTLLGALPHSCVLEEYLQSDLFLLPSHEEGVANVVLEAMALGIPVISTRCGGMEEVIEDGVSGFLVSVRDPEAIAGAVARYIEMSDMAGLIMNARKRIRERHLIADQAGQMVELYKEIMYE